MTANLAPMIDFVCPVCHAPVATNGSADVTCPSCGRQYADREGSFDFTPNPPPDPDVQEKWSLWEQLQHNFMVAATELPEHNLSLGRRKDARAFAAFADLRGVVLDVGCGPQREPSYFVGGGGEFVGIDPVRGERDRSFIFAQGIGEYLPFADGTFDRILFATSLDHVLSPVRTLVEARRVLTPTGTINIWFGEVDESGEPPSVGARLKDAVAHPGQAVRNLQTRLRGTAPPPPAYEQTLAMPEGAIDLYHFVHLSRPLVSEWLEQAGLTVSDAGHHANSVFLRAVPV
jgi:SAM-dependent methyltransferase